VVVWAPLPPGMVLLLPDVHGVCSACPLGRASTPAQRQGWRHEALQA
jgi:hypothetical protein